MPGLSPPEVITAIAFLIIWNISPYYIETNRLIADGSLASILQKSHENVNA
jgi:hypothetical protein